MFGRLPDHVFVRLPLTHDRRACCPVCLRGASTCDLHSERCNYGSGDVPSDSRGFCTFGYQNLCRKSWSWFVRPGCVSWRGGRGRVPSWLWSIIQGRVGRELAGLNIRFRREKTRRWCWNVRLCWTQWYPKGRAWSSCHHRMQWRWSATVVEWSTASWRVQGELSSRALPFPKVSCAAWPATGSGLGWQRYHRGS